MILLYVYAGMAVLLLPNYLLFFLRRAVLWRDYLAWGALALLLALAWPLFVRGLLASWVVSPWRGKKTNG